MHMERRRIKAVAGRKLACFAAAFSVFLFVFCYGLPRGQSLGWGLAAGVGLLSGLWFCAGWRQAAATVTLAFLLAGGVFYNGVLRPYQTAQMMDGTRGSFEAEVTALPREGDYYTVLEGARLHDGSRATVILYQTGLGLMPGDRVAFAGRAACNTDEELFSAMAEGSFLTLRASDGCTRILADTVPLRYRPLLFARSIREKVIGRYLKADAAGLLAALLTGDRSGISRPVKNQMALSGASHIIAVSGMHIGILSGFFVAWLGRRRGALAALPFLVFFGMMTGMHPPVVRAVAMALLVFAAFAADRENDDMTTVLVVLMGIGIFDPCTFVSVSLQMSFAAVLGILLLHKPIRRTLTAWLPLKMTENRLAERAVSAISVSVAASLAALPVTVFYFERISILAPLTNLAVLWLVPVLMGGGLVLLLLSPMPALAALFAQYGLEPLLRCFLGIVAGFADLPLNSLAVSDRPALALLTLWGVWLCTGFKIRPRLRTALCGLLLCLTLTLTGIRLYEVDRTLTCTVWADGMALLRQGREVMAVLPAEDTGDMADAYADRLYDMGRTKADLLLMTGIDDAAPGQNFRAAETLRLGADGAQGTERAGEMTFAAWGSSGMSQGVLIRWQGQTIIHACSTQQVMAVPDLAKEGRSADLLIVDSTLTREGGGLRRLAARTAPRQIVICNAGGKVNRYKTGSMSGLPVDWIEDGQSRTREWKEED